LAKVVDKDAEAAGGVAETPGGLPGRHPFDEKGAYRLVLAVGGVGGFKEAAA
jgi:hypothetical protein